MIKKNNIKTLVSRAKNGDKSAFEALYNEYKNKVYFFALSGKTNHLSGGFIRYAITSVSITSRKKQRPSVLMMITLLILQK